MEVTGIDNDTRGWIMTMVSGVACIVGASFICIDLIVCRFPGKRDFKISESNVFVAASLSLSAGIMLFTSLYGMLSSSKKYFIQGKLEPSSAAWAVIGCFSAGFLGIQVFSRLLHSHMSSSVVDCDHDHNHPPSRHQSRSRSLAHSDAGNDRGRHSHRSPSHSCKHTEATPLLDCANGNGKAHTKHHASHQDESALESNGHQSLHTPMNGSRRPSILEIGAGRVMSFVKDTKSNCDSNGPCFGYTDPCGQECYKHLDAKLTPSVSRHGTGLRTSTGNWLNRKKSIPNVETVPEAETEAPGTPSTRVTSAQSHPQEFHDECDAETEDSYMSTDLEAQHTEHHHHVPTNAFANLGIQTSLAIALHKIPEGFITYASNHVSPSLGFSVFMALFVHNLSEGFTLALPIYLAWNNRLTAMLASFFLGGLSQPIGAAVAAIWFKAADHSDHQPGDKVYGVMFGITAGIMTSVALALFVESLSMNHNRNLCVGFVFLGMAIIGASNALTA
ncbi:hypothetical protein BP6252_12834 [Coleophoma cylindrospora]|uniref:Uncharacterized protein n=1 Tax=Coleophoma cylindrospora TaxID=1849047 RepID=A0A3D8QDF0_9HELO|nr:hypothetical protein BP6252_12834 [Coleophoma cylindrospora]